jgi:ubiquinone/menaquinone biosynthesis C-methylase UbiE
MKSAAPSSHEISDKSLFDQIADHYARKDVIASTRLARQAIVRRAMLPVIKSAGSLGTLVDVGCGMGAQATYLDGNFERYIGIDYSDGLVDIGRQFFSNRDDVEFIVSNIKNTDLPERVADTVLVVTALHHMVDLKEVMEALRRIAKPGAHFIAIEPQRGNPIIQGMRRIRMKLDAHYSPDQHFFSQQELLEMLDLVPMTDKRIEFQGFLTPPFGQAGIKPQSLFLPVSQLSCWLEPVAETLCVGPLKHLSWNAVAYGRFK